MKRISFLCILVLTTQFAFSQTDSTANSLLNLLNDSIAGQQKADNKVIGTFKATQIVNLPTTEQPGKHNFQLMIMHRFGKLNGGAYEFFGLDNATLRLGLDYGVTDRLAIGIGRSSLNKTFDGSIKYKLLMQSAHQIPVTISIYELVTTQSLKFPDKPYLNLKYRSAYTSQLLIARKFTSAFSFELAPSWVHYNLVPTREDKNDIFNLAMGGRMKITKRISIDAEYDYLPGTPSHSTDLKSMLGLGIDIETGGHVFQLVFSNAQGMVGPDYLTGTTGRWGNGDIYFGFNISRAFGHNKQLKEEKKKLALKSSIE